MSVPLLKSRQADDAASLWSFDTIATLADVEHDKEQGV
jgi:hypothetical protein